MYQGPYCEPMENELISLPTLPGSVATVFSHQFELCFGMSPRTLSALEELHKTFICLEICFDC